MTMLTTANAEFQKRNKGEGKRKASCIHSAPQRGLLLLYLTMSLDPRSSCKWPGSGQAV